MAALWQAGYTHAVRGWDTRLNAAQFAQLASAPQVYIALDGDPAGRLAAAQLAARLRAEDRDVCLVRLPDGLDPAAYFAAGGSAVECRHWLERAAPWIG